MAWNLPALFTNGMTTAVTTGLNAIRDSLKAIGDPWTSYTPTLTGVTLGAGGTNTAKYMSAGKLTTVRGTITLGTGGALTATATVTYPVSSANAGFAAVGTAVYDDTSAGPSARRTGTAYSSSATVFQFSVGDNPAGASTNVSAAIPFTWAAGDTIAYTLVYEAA